MYTLLVKIAPKRIKKNCFLVITVFFPLLNDSEHDLCKTLTTVCTEAVHVVQTLVCFSSLEHGFQKLITLTTTCKTLWVYRFYSNPNTLLSKL